MVFCVFFIFYIHIEILYSYIRHNFKLFYTIKKHDNSIMLKSCSHISLLFAIISSRNADLEFLPSLPIYLSQEPDRHVQYLCLLELLQYLYDCVRLTHTFYSTQIENTGIHIGNSA